MKIAYLYYDFLNLYGESGNIKIISNILKYNKIKHEVLYLSLDDKLEFDKYDLVYIGSGTEDNLLIALKHLSKYKNDIKKYIDDNKFVLVTGNSVDMFGKKIEDNKALNIFDYEVTKGSRKMEEVYHNNILGFINNNSYNSEYNDIDIIRKNNFYGTYILGPILVRNPEFVKLFLNNLTNKKLKYDLKLETKAYNQFIKNFKENVNE